MTTLPAVRPTCLAVFLALAAPLHAQQPAPIERIKITDNEMNCAQMHAETVAMDKAIADSKAAADSGSNTAVAGQAGSVAAEVAGRTGLFGAFGGMAGALFGQAAAQTAAGVATQSGQQTAQQAAERSRQALARKEHVTGLFLARGCKASDLSYNPPAGAAPAAVPATAPAPGATPGTPDGAPRSQVTAPLAAAPTTLPEVDPDAHFKGKMGGTFGKNVTEVLPATRRVAVAGFRVVFITDNTTTATVRGSYLPGRDTSGASSSLHVTLTGVDHATMQALTDRAYADLLVQLKLAGREVVPQEQLKEFLAGVDTAAAAPGKPYVKENGAQSGVAFAPTGMPLWFSHADHGWTDRGLFDQKNYRLLAEHAQKWNAITVAPLLVLNYAQMSSAATARA